MTVLTTVLDVAGIAALVAFAWFCWPPAGLLVFGLACLYVSWTRS